MLHGTSFIKINAQNKKEPIPNASSGIFSICLLPLHFLVKIKLG